MRIRHSADLIRFDQHGVGSAELGAVRQSVDVGGKEVIADDLDSGAESVGELSPTLPIVLGHAVLNRDHGKSGGPLRQFCCPLGGGQVPILGGQDVALGCGVEELVSGNVEGDCHVGSRAETAARSIARVTTSRAVRLVDSWGP